MGRVKGGGGGGSLPVMSYREMVIDGYFSLFFGIQVKLLLCLTMTAGDFMPPHFPQPPLLPKTIFFVTTPPHPPPPAHKNLICLGRLILHVLCVCTLACLFVQLFLCGPCGNPYDYELPYICRFIFLYGETFFFSFSPQPILKSRKLDASFFFFFGFWFCCHFEVLSHYLHCLLTVFLVAGVYVLRLRCVCSWDSGVYVLRLRCVCFETQVCMFWDCALSRWPWTC